MSRERAKGTAWNSKVVAFLQDHGWTQAERRVLYGVKDKGDVTGMGVDGLPGLVIECKNANRYELAAWVDEANTEAANAGAEIGVVWAHRKGRASAADGYVILDGDTFARLLKAAGW